eukprot:365996-Chlamydomonas_euryale.AAC.2
MLPHSFSQPPTAPGSQPCIPLCSKAPQPEGAASPDDAAASGSEEAAAPEGAPAEDVAVDPLTRAKALLEAEGPVDKATMVGEQVHAPEGAAAPVRQMPHKGGAQCLSMHRAKEGMVLCCACSLADADRMNGVKPAAPC